MNWRHRANFILLFKCKHRLCFISWSKLSLSPANDHCVHDRPTLLSEHAFDTLGEEVLPWTFFCVQLRIEECAYLSIYPRLPPRWKRREKITTAKVKWRLWIHGPDSGARTMYTYSTSPSSIRVHFPINLCVIILFSSYVIKNVLVSGHHAKTVYCGRKRHRRLKVSNSAANHPSAHRCAQLPTQELMLPRSLRITNPRRRHHVDTSWDQTLYKSYLWIPINVSTGLTARTRLLDPLIWKYPYLPRRSRHIYDG